MRNQRDFGLQAKSFKVLGTKQHHVSNILGGGIGLDMGIGKERDATRGNHQAHGRQLFNSPGHADDITDVAQLGTIPPFKATNHCLCFATL